MAATTDSKGFGYTGFLWHPEKDFKHKIQLSFCIYFNSQFLCKGKKIKPGMGLSVGISSFTSSITQNSSKLRWANQDPCIPQDLRSVYKLGSGANLLLNLGPVSLGKDDQNQKHYHLTHL